MGMFNPSFSSLRDLLLFELQDLYDAEKRLVSALPKMAEAASSSKLAEAFKHHLKETETHVARLERAFDLMGEKAKAETCEAMKGLISEGEDIVKSKASDDIKDAALIAAAQRVEHYEMAGYGSARNFALQAGEPAVADLLQSTLNEEGEADHKLTQIAEQQVNAAAAAAN